MRPSRGVVAAAVVVGLLALVVVSQGRAPMAARLAALVLLMFEQGVVVMAYLAAAAGWGGAVVRLAREPALRAAGLAGRMIVGVGVMALGMWLLGWAGQLHVMTAWGLGTLGWALAAWQIYEARDRWWHEGARPWPAWPWPVALAAPPVALLLGAACIPPGILWASEFQGFDALSYHLQLPREWIEGGAVTGLTHNVYSYFPSLFELAFAQLGLWRGDMVEASYTAQLLHAAMAILTAVVIGRIVADRAGAVAGALAGALYLAVPWTVVTGSLAYNEQAVAAFAAVGLAVLLRLDGDASLPRPVGADVRAGAVVGVLAGLAVLTKLTAVGTVAAPFALLLAMNGVGGRRRQVARLAGFALAAGVVVGLWAIRNAAWTGNPVFPGLTGFFGTAHWTAEQAARWDAGHHGNPLRGLPALFPAGIGHLQFGLVVWPLTLAAAVFGWRHAAAGRVTKLLVVVMAVQLAFWLLLTHHQSRFLVPLLLPACVLIGLIPLMNPAEASPALLRGLGRWCGRVGWSWRATARAALAAAVVVCAAIGFGIYLAERDGRAAVFIDALHRLYVPDPQVGLATPYSMINRHVPPDGRVYAEAFAVPFYVQRAITYQTVWDASPLGRPFTVSADEDTAIYAAHHWLREQGYTHVVIDWHMFEIWGDDENYGYDPNVPPTLLRELAERALEPIDEVEGVAIYRVPAP